MGSTVQLLIEVLDLDLRPYECKHSCDYPHRFRFVFSLYLCLSAGETPLPSGSLQAQIESLEFFFLNAGSPSRPISHSHGHFWIFRHLARSAVSA